MQRRRRRRRKKRRNGRLNSENSNQRFGNNLAGFSDSERYVFDVLCVNEGFVFDVIFLFDFARLVYIGVC